MISVLDAKIKEKQLYNKSDISLIHKSLWFR